MIIVIPAYKPDEKFLRFLDDIYSRTDFKVLAVDDGGGSAYDGIFAEAEKKGVELIRYTPNRGKGFALKTAFKYIAEKYPDEYVVTADCDGQHTVPDILSVAAKTEGKKNTLVLGCRSIKDMPLRSKAGNSITKFFFYIFTGKMLTETQTGVRGITPDLYLPFSEIKGNRFEYEMNMLFEAADNGRSFEEAPISTTYIEDNKSTHFNGLLDGYRIYSLMVKNRAAEFLGFFAFNLISLLLSLTVISGAVIPMTVSSAVIAAACFRLIVMQITDFVKNKKLKSYRFYEIVCGLIAFLVVAAFYLVSVFVLGLTLPQAVFAAIPVSFAVRFILRAIKLKIKRK